MVASIQIHARHDATYRRPVRLRAAVERTEPNQVMGKLSATSETRGLTAGPAVSPRVSSGGPLQALRRIAQATPRIRSFAANHTGWSSSSRMGVIEISAK
jgi:hypothetical protein